MPNWERRFSGTTVSLIVVQGRSSYDNASLWEIGNCGGQGILHTENPFTKGALSVAMRG
jgi:hypothetical protein